MRINIRTPSKDEAPLRRSCHGIKAQLLIPGRGEPLQHAAVIVDGPKIVWVGRIADLPSTYESISFTHVPVAMPGMWDCHTHVNGMTIGDGLFGSQYCAGATAISDMVKVLKSGFTSIREVGGIGGEIRPAIKAGFVPGPHIYSSFGILSMTGGHADQHTIPLEVLKTAGYVGGLGDGPNDCVRQVRLQLRKGADFIKVCSTGGVGSEYDDPEDRQFSDEELSAMVQEAARARRLIAAHAHGKSGIMAALRAGIKTIEHGSYLDEEVAELMKEKGAILIATRVIVEQGLKMKSAWSPASYAKLEKIASVSRAMYPVAIKAGVKIALGTDTGISGDNPLQMGQSGQEVVYAVEAGMTPLQAIEAATATGPETLGQLAPLSGQLKAGYDADIIAIAGNPLEKIELLADPAQITHVWKDGKLWKHPGRMDLWVS